MATKEHCGVCDSVIDKKTEYVEIYSLWIANGEVGGRNHGDMFCSRRCALAHCERVLAEPPSAEDRVVLDGRATELPKPNTSCVS